jgi:hypothetical protein
MSREKFAENVARSPENLEQARRIIEARSMSEHALEAAAHAEDIIKWLQQEWGERGFSFEQCVFALALATINFRESMPEKAGGKEMFDRVAHEARKYYDANRQ